MFIQELQVYRFQRDKYPDLGCVRVLCTRTHPKSGKLPAKTGRARIAYRRFRGKQTTLEELLNSAQRLIVLDYGAFKQAQKEKKPEGVQNKLGI